MTPFKSLTTLESLGALFVLANDFRPAATATLGSTFAPKDIYSCAASSVPLYFLKRAGGSEKKSGYSSCNGSKLLTFGAYDLSYGTKF